MDRRLPYLPPTLVPYINALSHKLTDHQSERPGFLEALQQLEDWLEFQSGYSLDDEELSDFENLRHLHEQLHQDLELPTKKAQLDQLVPHLFQVVTLMDQVNARREAPHFSPQLAVNDFLLCGAAWLQGRASQEAVFARQERLEAYVQVLRHAFIGIKSRLVPQVVEDLETGLNHLRQGIAALSLESKEEFQDALATIKEGAEIMQFLIDWQSQDVRKQRERSSRFLIPEVGADFQEALEQARELPREQWRRGIRYLEQQALPRLQATWADMRHRIFWEPEQRLILWEEIEVCLEDLAAAVQDLDNPEISEDRALDGLEEALENLSSAFSQARAHSVSHQHLLGTQAGLYIEALLGGLNQTLPFVAFPELFHSSPPPEEWKPIVDAILEFGEELDPDPLFRAGYLLLQRFPPPQEDDLPGEQPWVCPSCSQTNSAAVTRCVNCHLAPVSLSATVWSG